MKTINPIFISFLLFLFVGSETILNAQNRPTRARKIERASSSSEVKVYKVKPGDVSKRKTAQATAGLGEIAAAKDPTGAKKKVWIQGHGTLPPPPPHATNIATKPEAMVTQLEMSARDPYKGVLGHLEFNEVRHMDCDEDYVVWYMPNSGMGYMKAFVKVEKGEKYLIDFNIGCDDTREFHFSTTGGSQKTTYNKGSHHLVSIIEASGSGLTSMMLWADHQWSFYGLEVTKLD